MMRVSMSAIATAVALHGATLPTQATETTTCTGDGASISLLMGSVPVAAIAKADMEAGTRRWSTEKQDGLTAVSVGQAFETSELLHVDITNDNVSEVLARLRVYKASESDFYAAGGTLWISGVGAWAVTCSGP